jgi:hypothetical protein
MSGTYWPGDKSDFRALDEALKVIKKIIKSKLRRAAKDCGSQLLVKQDHKGAWKCVKALTFTNRKGSEPLKN